MFLKEIMGPCQKNTGDNRVSNGQSRDHLGNKINNSNIGLLVVIAF